MKKYILLIFACIYAIHLNAQNAGINKKLTYHMSRHTFATMELTMGADLYTTSQLLGHADVETTQVYAKIIDAKKEAAVLLIDSLF